MGKYAQDAKELLRLVGGKENIAAVTHCMTRMRFALQDPAKADVPAIEALASVKGSFTQAGQFQVIIGNDVADFYDDFVAVSGVSEASKADVKAASANNQNKLQQLMGVIAEVFAPLAALAAPATEQARVGPSRPASFFSDPRLLCIPSAERTGVRLCRPGLFPPDPSLLCIVLLCRWG